MVRVFWVLLLRRERRLDRVADLGRVGRTSLDVLRLVSRALSNWLLRNCISVPSASGPCVPPASGVYESPLVPPIGLGSTWAAASMAGSMAHCGPSTTSPRMAFAVLSSPARNALFAADSAWIWPPGSETTRCAEISHQRARLHADVLVMRRVGRSGSQEGRGDRAAPAARPR